MRRFFFGGKFSIRRGRFVSCSVLAHSVRDGVDSIQRWLLQIGATECPLVRCEGQNAKIIGKSDLRYRWLFLLEERTNRGRLRDEARRHERCNLKH
jgi:hypothetical protein